MLLVIDIGNTNTVIGVYDQDNRVQNWRIRTERNTTEDEFNVLISGLFRQSGITPAMIQKTVISSVVPPMVTILDSFCRKYLGRKPKWVDATKVSRMPILCHNPAEVGADRIVNAVGAYQKYQSSLIVIDFGTATTFDCISEKGAYLGGAISPGIMIAAEALFAHASKLPRVEIFSPPRSAIGRDTIASIQSGIIYGYASLVDGMVERLRQAMDTDPRVVATGGLADLMRKVCSQIEVVEPDLTLDGLKLISENTD